MTGKEPKIGAAARHLLQREPPRTSFTREESMRLREKLRGGACCEDREIVMPKAEGVSAVVSTHLWNNVGVNVEYAMC